MGRRVVLLGLVMLLLGLHEAHADTCVRHTPLAWFAPRVTVTAPGEDVAIDVYLRNRDTCGCPRQCFQLTDGVQPPHDATLGLRFDQLATRDYSELLTEDGVRAPGVVCLAPGEEAERIWHARIAADTEQPAFATPIVTLFRQGATYYGPTWAVDYYVAGGAAVCAGYTAPECRARTYETSPLY